MPNHYAHWRACSGEYKRFVAGRDGARIGYERTRKFVLLAWPDLYPRDAMAEGSQFSVDLLLPTQDVAVVVANGEIDLFTAPQLQETLAEGVESGTRSVIVDLAEVPFIDSSGIDVIVSTFRRLQKDGRRLNVVCDRANVLHVFKVTGLLDLFAFYATREEALAATGEPHPPE